MLGRMYRVCRTRPAPKSQLRLVVLDGAGTTCDPWALTPIRLIQQTLHDHGYRVTMPECAAPIGLRKAEHIQAIFEKNALVRDQFVRQHGVDPSPEALHPLVQHYVGLQLQHMEQASELIHGVSPSIEQLQQEQHLKVGLTTGYNRKMVNQMMHFFDAQGVALDGAIAGDDVLHGSRPSPFMMYQLMSNLGVTDVRTVVKVGDSTHDIAEGLHAGSWTVGLYGYSPYTGVTSLKQWQCASRDVRERLQDRARDKLIDAGAHYVIPSFNALPQVCVDINRRLSHGESPQ